MYEQITKLVSEQHISLPILARDSGVPLQTLYNLKAREGKGGTLSAMNAYRVAKALGVTVEDLLGVRA